MKFLILLKCINPKNTLSFYENIGISWNKVAHEQKDYYYNFCDGLNMIIPNEQYINAYTEFVFIDEKLHPKEPNPDKIAIINEEFKFIFPYLKKKNRSKIILVFRSDHIENTKNAYEKLGKWILEKHDKGPLHYCLEDNINGTIEIYKKNHTDQSNFEFVIDNASPYISSLKKHIVKLSDKSTLYKDPDLRSVRLLKDGLKKEAPR